MIKNTFSFNTRFWLLALLSLFVLSSCSWLPDEIDETVNWTAEELYTEAKNHLQEGELAKAIEFYEKVGARYPHSRYAQQAQMELAYAYYKDDEPEFALAEIKRFIKTYPKHPNLDYLYYLRGMTVFPERKSVFEFIWPQDESKRDTKISLESFQYFDLLVRKFPDSIYAEDARLRMKYLKNKVSKHELHIAKFYYDSGAYLAAVNRASFVVKNLQETPAVGAALLIMVKAYKKLGMDSLAKDTQLIYDTNKEKNGFIDDVFLEDESILSEMVPDWLKFK
ncbi:MAG: outer membrane protein assembly factor BamD [Gammaproteobacteria bacterium]|nr:outer membrane protein assembly factor BamD [Gammaproteobacteria bacterium]